MVTCTFSRWRCGMVSICLTIPRYVPHLINQAKNISFHTCICISNFEEYIINYALITQWLCAVCCSEKSKRRTKTMANTTDPTWNQTFIYCPVKESDLRERLLEITAWDYDRIGASEFLGEVGSDLVLTQRDQGFPHGGPGPSGIGSPSVSEP